MSLLKAPSSVIARLESLQKRFLWTGTTDPKKLHWIHWDTIKCSKSRGGLRVQDLRILNTALLSKWTWRYATERSAWWRTLISSKCGTGPSDWISIWNFSSSGYSMWKGVIAFGSIFWTYGSIDPGGGMCDFWRDYWVRGMRLASLFPRIDASAQSLDARLCDVFHFSDRFEWSIPLRYQLRGGALEEWHNFLLHLVLIPQTLLTEGPTYIYWPLHSKGLFTVASLRQELNATRFVGNSNFPSDVIWVPFIPPKFTSFCWKAFHKRIATIDNLQRRGFSFANRCVMCYCSTESVDHLFLQCSFVTRVWNLLISALSFHGPLHSELVGFIKA
ncbi:Putative ribonuclease H protein At1g65750 [Linum perenne]